MVWSVDEKVGHENVGEAVTACKRQRGVAGRPPTGAIRKQVIQSSAFRRIALLVGSQSLQRHRQQMLDPVFVRSFERLNRTQEPQGFFKGSDGGLMVRRS